MESIGEKKCVIGHLAPEFTTEAFHENDVKKISLKDYRGKWVVLFFYPADFTFICPTELSELADNYSKLQGLGAEVLSVSTDTAFVHKAWHDNSESIKKITFPMVADPTGNICRSYGTYILEEGLSLRGTFLIDPEGVLKAYEIHDNSIGRNINELIRKLEAAKFTMENGGEVCPVNWKPGAETLKPGLDLVGKI
ncbi:redoxin domain-containing protein [archaeon]|jgi:NADH-dependent peroxiredoxin subunit C|nr:redoxin domain-containing protein [archaeon]MBT6182530.1 redoxin domain-containing protein [archaeon]MBT6606411.1 redoxin domain-containing protein [archaeon]MBT7251420.1 redoxin domain-containing protein [archaeon]MBT7660475.1 redoxin domain-containing protein [archaeon]